MNKWDSLDVELPELQYENLTVSGQGKGSTEFAAHSHTPNGLKAWTEFAALIEEVKNSRWAQQSAPINLSVALGMMEMEGVSNEEEVTSRTQQVLTFLRRYSNCQFRERSGEIQANPDIIAMERRDEQLGVGPARDYASPINRSKTRRATLRVVKDAYKFPFETKPHWKFNFLNHPASNETIIREWEVPSEYTPQMICDRRTLPATWSRTKTKVFHVVRQLYGQMVADNCRYGILHTYEYWFFCMRTEAGWLHISRGFAKEEKSPSVLQAVMTLFQRSDHRLCDSDVHPQSARKVPKKPKVSQGKGPGTGSGQKTPLPRDKGNVAALVKESDSTVYDVARNVSLLSNTMYPNMLIKMQKRGSRHVASEMEREATMYMELAKNNSVAQVIPTFYGFSRHWGVPIICLEKEGDDFDDLGLQNLSLIVRQSALSAVQVLSDAGILHNDLALRNFVVSGRDKNVAKIIDFGRSSISSDQDLLKDQVKEARQILGVNEQN